MSLFILVSIVSGAVYYIKKTSDFKKTENKSSSTQVNELSSEEIKKISKSVVLLLCFGKERTEANPTGALFGSGILFDKNIFEGKLFDDVNSNYMNTSILTNGHVAELKKISSNDINLNNCIVSFSGKKLIRTYSYNQSNHFLNGKFDLALLEYAKEIGGKKQEGRPSISDKSLKDRVLKNYKTCSKDKMVGNKVYVFGYPTSALKMDAYKEEHNLIITSGIISGIDGDGNYYTDAKIDSENSGGLAVLRVENEICLAGIPTWVSQGNFENLGLIQPFKDVAKLFKGDFEGQLYENDEYEFSIKFPKGWQVVDDSNEKYFAKKAESDLMNSVSIRMSYHLGASLFFANQSFAQPAELGPPLITTVSKDISNEEIFYVAGKADLSDSEVIIYLQNLQSGETANYRVASNKRGD